VITDPILCLSFAFGIAVRMEIRCRGSEGFRGKKEGGEADNPIYKAGKQAVWCSSLEAAQ